MIPTLHFRWVQYALAEKVLQQWWVMPPLRDYPPSEVEKIAANAGEWKNVPTVEQTQNGV